MYRHYLCQQVRIYDNYQQNFEVQSQSTTAHMKNTYRVLDMVLQLYNSAGFHVKTIHANGEFCTMMERVNDNLGVHMNFTNALDHVPEAEWNNRTIKERVRGAYHRLPYKALPKQLILYLVQMQASQLNLFPGKGELSLYYSPRTTMLGLPHWTMPNIAWCHVEHTCRPTTKQSNKFKCIQNAGCHLPQTGE
jgi:hypothetical protein